MPGSRRLSRKQLALIDDLFNDESDEQRILDKHKIDRQLFHKWLADDQFTEELNERVAGAYRQCTFLLARNAKLAAHQLVRLTQRDTGETARKACLDIITMNLSTRLSGPHATAKDKCEAVAPISPQTAGRLLAVLAREQGQQ